jgi:hypothetical protein
MLGPLPLPVFPALRISIRVFQVNTKLQEITFSHDFLLEA